jgi:hypothetical protein
MTYRQLSAQVKQVTVRGEFTVGRLCSELGCQYLAEGAFARSRALHSRQLTWTSQKHHAYLVYSADPLDRSGSEGDAIAVLIAAASYTDCRQ